MKCDVEELRNTLRVLTDGADDVIDVKGLVLVGDSAVLFAIGSGVESVGIGDVIALLHVLLKFSVISTSLYFVSASVVDNDDMSSSSLSNQLSSSSSRSRASLLNLVELICMIP